MKSMRFVAAAAFLVLAACSSSATEPAATRADRPSFDGVNTLGSGNVAGDDRGNSVGSDSEVQSTSTVLSDTTGRGGNTMGSGN
jgi:hypothetical protein